MGRVWIVQPVDGWVRPKVIDSTVVQISWLNGRDSADQARAITPDTFQRHSLGGVSAHFAKARPPKPDIKALFGFSQGRAYSAGFSVGSLD